MSSPPRQQPARAVGARGGTPAQERELRAQGKKTMRKLLDAGMTVFERRGYHAARVDDIVRVARTSHGTFYLYFANKEDLFHALTADLAGEMMALAESLEPIGPDHSGWQAVRGWLSRFADLYDHYGPVIRAWTEAEIGATESERLGTDLLARFSRTLESRIRAAGTGGVEPQTGAVAMVAMVERFNYYVLSRQVETDRDVTLDTLATVAHRGFFGAPALA